MKLHKSVRIKDTVSLFMNAYQYKVVLVCAGANWFRGNDLDFVASKLQDLDSNNLTNPPWLKFKNDGDKEYCVDVFNAFKTLTDYEIRVEHPIINFYTNNKSHVELLTALDPERIKYICIPNKQNPSLEENTVIVKKLDYDYKVHIGRTRRSHADFISWANGSDKIRLTPRVTRDLNHTHSWGGGYFYVKGDKVLTMVKMFVGSEINKIERVIKA